MRRTLFCVFLVAGAFGQHREIDINIELRKFQAEQVEEWNTRWNTFLRAWNSYADARNHATLEIDARAPRALDADALRERGKMLAAWSEFEKIACSQKMMKKLGGQLRQVP